MLNTYSLFFIRKYLPSARHSTYSANTGLINRFGDIMHSSGLKIGKLSVANNGWLADHATVTFFLMVSFEYLETVTSSQTIFLYINLLTLEVISFLYVLSFRFSFCQYPFIISIAAKKVIIQRDSEQQMINIARVSIFLAETKRKAKHCRIASSVNAGGKYFSF